MKALRMFLVAVALFAFGCGSDLSPTAPPLRDDCPPDWVYQGTQLPPESNCAPGGE